MVVLRATQKVLKLLPPSAGDAPISTTALGDWYVNRIVVDRRPLLLLVSSTSRLPIVTTARDIKSLPHRLAKLLEERLRRLGVSGDCLACEVEAASVVVVSKTIDRSVTGQMVDFAKMLPSYLPELQWDEEDLKFAEDRLEESRRASLRFEDVIFPREAAIQMLESKWRRGLVH
jgi:hypothetical protein